MTAVADAKTIIDTLRGKVSTNDELQRISDRAMVAQEKGIRVPMVKTETVFADPDNPTNEEKAQQFLDMMGGFLLLINQRSAVETAEESVQATIDTARAQATADCT